LPLGIEVIVPVTTLPNRSWVNLLSHELGGPIAVLRGYSSMWIEGRPGDDGAGLLGLGQQTWLNAESLTGGLNELLKAARTMPETADPILASAVRRFVSEAQPVVRRLRFTLGSWLLNEGGAAQPNHILSVQTCHAKALMLSGLIGQLSLATSLDAAAEDWRVIDVRAWLRHLSHEIAGALTATGHRLLLESDGTPAEALITSDLLQAAVFNLLDNAQKHSPPCAPIVVSAACADEWVMVQVSDRGPGLPEGLVPTPFTRIDRPSVFELPGLGLGLTIAAKVAQIHGGELWHERRDGGGSVFTTMLPRLT
jgi:signal transduction histidine kinase